MSNSMLALLASYVDSSNDWLSDSNNAVYGYMTVPGPSVPGPPL